MVDLKLITNKVQGCLMSKVSKIMYGLWRQLRQRIHLQYIRNVISSVWMLETEPNNKRKRNIHHHGACWHRMYLPPHAVIGALLLGVDDTEMNKIGKSLCTCIKLQPVLPITLVIWSNAGTHSRLFFLGRGDFCKLWAGPARSEELACWVLSWWFWRNSLLRWESRSHGP